MLPTLAEICYHVNPAVQKTAEMPRPFLSRKDDVPLRLFDELRFEKSRRV